MCHAKLPLAHTHKISVCSPSSWMTVKRFSWYRNQGRILADKGIPLSISALHVQYPGPQLDHYYQPLFDLNPSSHCWTPTLQAIVGPTLQAIVGLILQAIAGPILQAIVGPILQDIVGPILQSIAVVRHGQSCRRSLTCLPTCVSTC